jgi:O-methyltransferase
VAAVGYPGERLHFVAGDVAKTIPEHAPEAIALLRLDTDFYASTRHELEQLYPRLSPGGVLIIDDYGDWAGARKATDEYFATHKPQPLLIRVDVGARMGIKPGTQC